MTTSYYEILRVTPSSSDEDVKRAYKFLAKKHHPDMHPQNRRLAELRFRAIHEAYTNLQTREKRATYNQQLRRLRARNDNSANKSLFGAFGRLFKTSQRRRG